MKKRFSIFRKYPILFGLLAVAVGLCAFALGRTPTQPNRAATRNASPNWQMQANARTALAGLRYLLENDREVVTPAMAVANVPSSYSFAVHAPPSGADFRSNQSELVLEAATNQPARS